MQKVFKSNRNYTLIGVSLSFICSIFIAIFIVAWGIESIFLVLLMLSIISYGIYFVYLGSQTIIITERTIVIQSLFSRIEMRFEEITCCFCEKKYLEIRTSTNNYKVHKDKERYLEFFSILWEKVPLIRECSSPTLKDIDKGRKIVFAKLSPHTSYYRGFEKISYDLSITYENGEKEIINQSKIQEPIEVLFYKIKDTYKI